ncbi:TPA: hypothetical protein ACJGT4_002104 [Salmonella enterica subsp. enterica]|nr:hypothetical protein [Salmonella enterica]ECC5260893.1 hypothetical protein [Salmonella enterica]MIL94135.1 hypothetical protein [Salmonella enterica]
MIKELEDFYGVIDKCLNSETSMNEEGLKKIVRAGWNWIDLKKKEFDELLEGESMEWAKSEESALKILNFIQEKLLEGVAK